MVAFHYTIRGLRKGCLARYGGASNTEESIMENFTASIHNLFNHRPANHQPDTAAWVGNIRQLREQPPAVEAIVDALIEL
mgnify:CR=1 FL=1